MKEKDEKWGPRIGCMSRVNGKMEENRGRLIWELLAMSCLEHAAEVWLSQREGSMQELGKNSSEHWQETGGWK